MDIFVKPLLELAEVGEIRERMQKGRGVLALSGCLDAQKAHILYGLTFDKDISLILTENDLAAKTLAEDLAFYDSTALYYPAKDLLFYQVDVASNLLDRQRMQVFRALAEGGKVTVVAPAAALMDQVATKESLTDRILAFETGEETDLIWARDMLAKRGYERTAEVVLPGQFAVRGDILDVWSLTEDQPFRIELFGDEIESIRVFDPESQRSAGELSRVHIYPARDDVGTLASFLGWFEDESAGITVGVSKRPAANSANASGSRLSGSFRSFAKPAKPNPPKICICLDDPNRIVEALKAAEDEFRESVRARAERGEYHRGDKIPEILGTNELLARLSLRRTVAVSALEMRRDRFEVEASYGMTVQSAASYNNSFELLAEDLAKYRKRGWRVLLVSPSQSRAKRLAQDLAGLDIPAYYTDNRAAELLPGQAAVMQGHMRRGFEYPLIKMAFITEADIYGAKRPAKKKRKRYNGEAISSFSELHIGDYVVHENHGLGIYRGIEKMKVEDALKDYIKIEYKGGNLYILATQLDVLQKYGGSEGAKPRLNTLGGKEWDATKTRVRSAVKDIAADLVRLYAAREREDGFVFSQDNEWQREFEELFPFEETEDQLAAIEDTKRDMESRKIMDRLICGDVGYGKTEIAIRAAFKAVQDGKQVAFLVPTTILAQQHYNTFMQRMKEFPIRVDLLCRFRTSAEIKKTVADLQKGLVDIVVGTHRLLSKDIAFKDLGLLVIDEEQRFGVTHKEKIKQLRKDVDVLTLTATPIPRTLHMSLSGIREMSVLEEPPRDRLPIQTYVSEYSDEIVREAICRELARHGQVYFVHNRVADIAERAERIHNLVPEANVAFAHGKMRPAEIEDIMVDFINGEIDVLVTTTIVETGLDIANVNTIIINDADRYGLSQLYQLRGRVGRSSRTAYAFLMYRRDKMLKEVAEKRLSAIREFTQLGSGFRIAMRDLEIRGAGNLLGAEQHGQMEAVGYDLYCKMLASAVREAKGEEPERIDFETVVDLAADAFIPDEYIPDEFLKLDFYKRIAAIRGEADYEDISDELMDRFGELPQPVRNLLAIADLKAAAHAASIEEIKEKRDGIRLKVHRPPAFDPAGVPRILAAFGGMFRLDAQKPGEGFTYHGPQRTGELILNMKTFCRELADTVSQ